MAKLEVPDEAVEAACLRCYGRNWTDFHPRFTLQHKDFLRGQMREDLVAALSAWPGASNQYNWETWRGVGHSPDRIAIILPLTETRHGH